MVYCDLVECSLYFASLIYCYVLGSYFSSVICPHINVHLFCYSLMRSYLMIMFLSMLSLSECHYKYCTSILQYHRELYGSNCIFWPK